MYDIVVKSSRSLSHLLMSFLYNLSHTICYSHGGDNKYVCVKSKTCIASADDALYSSVDPTLTINRTKFPPKKPAVKIVKSSV